MADNDALILGEIQDKYAPFLKRMVSFFEKNHQKLTPDNLSMLKSIYTVFTTSSTTSEQIDTFKAHKKKLEKWYKQAERNKMTAGNDNTSASSGSKRPVEETDFLGESAAKRTSSSAGALFDPSLAAQIKKEKAEQPRAQVAVVQLVQQSVAAAVASNDDQDEGGEVQFLCASCQYQSPDENEFIKHLRTDHRSDLSMWCKQCGKCFSNVVVLVGHIKERQCYKEEMIYKCGVKDCTFETTSGQTFVHHLRHFHKGSPFIFCVHCQKIFTLPHCLILHMQDDCPHKEKNRRNPGSRPPALTPQQQQQPPRQPVLATPVSGFQSHTPPIASVSGNVQPVTPVVVRGGLTPSSISIERGRGRGRGRGRVLEESSNSDDPDDPSWKPEELPDTSMLRRSGRFAKKVNVTTKAPSKGVTAEMTIRRDDHSNNAELKQHTQALHPTLEQKSISGFHCKRSLERDGVDDNPPNKPKFVCNHCGAAYSTREGVTNHSRKAHVRLPAKFRVEVADKRQFYKCQFCHFRSEQDFLDLHLSVKHKNRVTCGHCAKRCESVTKVKRHHGRAHKKLPLKYSQETLPFIKKEPLDKVEASVSASPSKGASAKDSISKNALPKVAPKNPVSEGRPLKTRPKASTTKNPKSPSKKMVGLNAVFVTTDGPRGVPSSKLSLGTFSRIYNIHPEVVLKRCDSDESA